MKLLTETIEDVKYVIEEVGADKPKRMFIEGVFLQSEQKNRNGRIYPKVVLARECNRYIKECVDRNQAWGELNHPDTPNINLDRVSHRIVSLKEAGNDWIGKAALQNTNHGKIAQALIEGGGRLGVSSRGIGSLKMVEGANFVQDDYHLSTAADIVADPSAPDAFVQGLMEQKEWCWSNGVIKEADVSAIYNQVKAAKQHNLEVAMFRAFKDYMSKL